MLLATAVSGWLVSPPSGVVSPTRAVRSRAVVMQEFDEKMWNEYANPETYEGTSLRVVEYPDPVLRAVATEIVEFDEKLNTLCEEMFTVMYASKGVGLAAPQVAAVATSKPNRSYSNPNRIPDPNPNPNVNPDPSPNHRSHAMPQG